jgi:hypothetical protein
VLRIWDPAFLTPGPRLKLIPEPDPGDLIFENLGLVFWVKNTSTLRSGSGIFSTLDLGSGINMPDPKHWIRAGSPAISSTRRARRTQRCWPAASTTTAWDSTCSPPLWRPPHQTTRYSRRRSLGRFSQSWSTKTRLAKCYVNTTV